MNAFAVLTAIAAWACLFFAPRGTFSRVVQTLGFGLLGTVFVLAGGFAYWWDSGMRPTQKDATIFVCGILTVISALIVWLQAATDAEFGPDPRKRRR